MLIGRGTKYVVITSVEYSNDKDDKLALFAGSHKGSLVVNQLSW